jgi:hypothetical protein
VRTPGAELTIQQRANLAFALTLTAFAFVVIVTILLQPRGWAGETRNYGVPPGRCTQGDPPRQLPPDCPASPR